MATARRPEALADFEVAGSLLLDVHSDESVATVRREVGPVDLPVNNAGWGVEGPNEEVPLDEVRRAMETDYFGAARMIQAFLPGMRDQGSGVIANVTSIAGVVSPGSCRRHRADALRPPRTPWKRSRRRSTSNVVTWGIRVQIVEPGGVDTEFGADMAGFRRRPGPYSASASQWNGAMESLRGDQASLAPDVVATATCDA